QAEPGAAGQLFGTGGLQPSARGEWVGGGDAPWRRLQPADTFVGNAAGGEGNGTARIRGQPESRRDCPRRGAGRRRPEGHTVLQYRGDEYADSGADPKQAGRRLSPGCRGFG